jgi:hypothetical protein
MAPKPKAGGAKKRPAKAALPKAKEKEKPQRERFIEAAREVGVDETGREFERALVRIVPPKRQARQTP